MTRFLDGIELDSRRRGVVIYLTTDSAMDLYMMLPERDGFARDLWSAIKALEDNS